ncbi:MAG: hypothetical protein Q8P41_26735 [Pseudomonadota bacterium]|nr:hypothetical protein [Pseudomonadota bacterium]
MIALQLAWDMLFGLLLAVVGPGLPLEGASVLWLLLEVAFLVALGVFVRGLGGSPLKRLGWAALSLSGADALLVFVELFAPVHPNWLRFGLFVVGRLVFWRLISRCASGLPPLYGRLFYGALVVSATCWFLQLAPLHHTFQLVYLLVDPLLGLALTPSVLVGSALQAVVVWRLSRGGTELPGAAGTGAWPIDPASVAAGKGDLLVGGLVLAGGLGVTLAAYLATEAGGAYIVTTGAIAYGLFRVVRGLFRMV